MNVEAPVPTRPCSICGVPSVSPCSRCGRPLCLEHQPRDSLHRCTDCELEFTQRRTSLLASVVLVLLLFIALAGAWGFGLWLDRHGYLIARGGDTVWAQFAVYFSLTLGVVGCAGAALWIGRALRRRRFLLERPARRRP